MNIDINSRIAWQPGMVLSAETFGNLDDNIELRQRIALRTQGRQTFGLMPDAPFAAKGFFANGHYEIEQLELTALLLTGDIISPHEPVSIPFKRRGREEYCYLCVGFGIGYVEYEHNNVPYLRPEYEYTIKTLSEIEAERDVLPFVRFRIADDAVSIDDSYIVPCLICSGNPHIMEYVGRMADALTRLAEHSSMPHGDAHQTLLRYIFRLRGYSPRNTIDHLIELTEEIMQAIHYFIVAPNDGTTRNPHPSETEKLMHKTHTTKPAVPASPAHPAPTYADIELWLRWCEDYIAKAMQVLDGVVLIDDTIDLTRLKDEVREELRQQLYGPLHDELTTSIAETLYTRMHADIDSRLDSLLRGYVDGTVRQELHNGLHGELRPDLYDTLYRALYEALYDALQTPEPVEEHFYTPII